MNTDNLDLFADIDPPQPNEVKGAMQADKHLNNLIKPNVGAVENLIKLEIENESTGLTVVEQPLNSVEQMLIKVEVESKAPQAIMQADNNALQPLLNTTDPTTLHWQQALKMTKTAINNGFVLTHVHCYTDAQGKPIYYKLRAKHPTFYQLDEVEQKRLIALVKSTKHKVVKPFHFDGKKWQWCEPKDYAEAYPQGNGKKPLYLLHTLANAKIVRLLEGEQKAELLASFGLIATTTGSSQTIKTTDLTPLAGCIVVLMPDSDKSSIDWINAAKAELLALGCTVLIADNGYLGLTGERDNNDIIDWYNNRTAQGISTTRADIEAIPLIELKPEVVETEPVEASQLDPTAEIERLALLSVIEYEQQRINAAKDLGFSRTSALDQMVKTKRFELVQSKEQSLIERMFNEVEPHSEPVDGVALLDAIHTQLNRFIVCEPQAAQAATLWIVFTWCIDAMNYAPMAFITAPEPECGKSTLLEFIKKLCYRPFKTINLTASVLFRTMDMYHPTLLIDEADSFLNEANDIRGVLNGGVERDAFIMRSEGDNHEPTPFCVWGAKAICGIGSQHKTLTGRSIKLMMRRKTKDEKKEFIRYFEPELVLELRQKLARWSADNINEVRYCRPVMPDFLENRGQDVWDSLFKIADVIGGHWPATARQSALKISGNEIHEPSLNEMLLADIKEAFTLQNATRLQTIELLNVLNNDADKCWATYNRGKELSQHQLAQKLKGYGISPKNIRFGSTVKKGYELTQFNDAFARYLPKTPIQTATPLQPIHRNSYSEFKTATLNKDVADEKALKSLPNKDCSDVADITPVLSDVCANGANNNDYGEITI